MNPYKVFVRIDERGCVTSINSSAFLSNLENWVEIDSGHGDKYHHAQGNYLSLPITDDRGIYRYKLADGKIAERSQEEMDADYVEPAPELSSDERINKLEAVIASYEKAYKEGVNEA